MRLPDGVNTAPVRFRWPGVRVAIEPRPGEVSIRASARSLRGHRVQVDAVVVYPPGQQTLDVTVPFDRERSHFTSKHVGLPVRARVAWDGEVLAFDDAWACLDHGRGVWPWRTSWCWAAAAGTSQGRRVAFNLGGVWTDGTGTTENGFWIDGRLHRIGATLAFRRASPGWLVEGPGVALAATAVRERPLQANLGVLRADLDWTMARFTGSVVADDGESLRLPPEGLLGWCERLDARW